MHRNTTTHTIPKDHLSELLFTFTGLPANWSIEGLDGEAAARENEEMKRFIMHIGNEVR